VKLLAATAGLGDEGGHGAGGGASGEALTMRTEMREGDSCDHCDCVRKEVHMPMDANFWLSAELNLF
jgi:hypothetical protein